MAFNKQLRFATVTLACVLALTGAALAADHGVDAGVFGIFVKGQRIATEKFQIQQGATTNTTSSEFRLENGERKASQKAELQLDSAGNLRRYEWRELSPGKAQIVVEPNDQFLVERITPNPPDPPLSQPFMVPASTMVLDDYFFSQRQILAWRYLAQSCNGNVQQCRPGRVQFGVLVPQQRASALVTFEYAGTEKVNIKGVERELNRLNMKVDEVDWTLYLDPSSFKLLRIVIPSEQTEVVRD